MFTEPLTKQRRMRKGGENPNVTISDVDYKFHLADMVDWGIIEILSKATTHPRYHLIASTSIKSFIHESSFPFYLISFVYQIANIYILLFIITMNNRSERENPVL